MDLLLKLSKYQGTDDSHVCVVDKLWDQTACISMLVYHLLVA